MDFSDFPHFDPSRGIRGSTILLIVTPNGPNLYSVPAFIKSVRFIKFLPICVATAQVISSFSPFRVPFSFQKNRNNSFILLELYSVTEFYSMTHSDPVIRFFSVSILYTEALRLYKHDRLSGFV